MAEIASGTAMSGDPTAAGKRAAGQEASLRLHRRRSSPRSSRPWSMRCRPGSDWIHEYKYDGYRLLIATGEGAATAWTRNGKDWSDKFREPGPSRGQAARRMPDRRRSGRARRQGQARLPAAPGHAQGRERGQPRILCLRPVGGSGRGHPQATQHRAQGAARGFAQDGERADHLRRSYRRARARRCSTRSARRAARGSSRRKPTRPIAARARATGSRSNASSARNS